MSRGEVSLDSFLREVMSRRRRLPSQMAADLGVSHAAMSRWLSGQNVPNTRSCQRLAEYSGVSVDKVLSIVGHITVIVEDGSEKWPEFREYARKKYPSELDEDLVTMVEYLIEQRRARRHGGNSS